MSMTGKEWKEHIENLSKDQRDKYAEAIGVLLSWDTFEEHYGYYGMGTIKFFLETVED